MLVILPSKPKETNMINITYKRLLNIVLVTLVAGCSSSRQVACYPPTTTSTTTTASIPRPSTPPVAKLPSLSNNLPESPVASTQVPAGKQFIEAGNYYATSVSGDYANSADLQSFIQYMVQKHGFSQTYLNGLFSQAAYLESVVRLEEPPASSHSVSVHPSKGSWSRYRQQFLTEAHINNGVAFWRENESAIQKASSTYGVDPEYIVAIIGVETFFGRNVGKTRTLDALTTLAFDTQRRAKFFTAELEHFLLITREEGYEPLSIVGSWAGAMGLGQFMPSSFRKLAVDFNNDGKRDLWQPDDAIGSVANYFSRSGWQYQAPVAEQSNQGDGFSTVELSTNSGSEFWSVYPNFKVIKKYNSSDKYAMAVHQLAQACKQRYQYQ
jgi:membrane-bound lytic murein transglycosylase B